VSGARIIPIAAYLPQRAPEPQPVDLVEAWRGRREQLLGEAELITREIGAYAEALGAAVDRVRALGGSTTLRLGEIHAQIELIDRAVENWIALQAAAEASATDVETGGG
jgi:hypothetical protein